MRKRDSAHWTWIKPVSTRFDKFCCYSIVNKNWKDKSAKREGLGDGGFQTEIASYDSMETYGQWLRDIMFKSFLYLLDHITFFSNTVAGLITRLGWHPDIWGRKASFVHLLNSSWGWRKALINCWRNAGPLWWHALPLSFPSHTHIYPLVLLSSLSPSLPLSLTPLPSTSRKLAKTLGKPACVYHPLNACHVESSACHLNAL